MKSPPKIVLTNDDGFQAPGLAALNRACEGLGERILVAPRLPQSGVGHRLTTDAPILVEEVARGCIAVSGSPADCSRVALSVLAPDAAWVFSGINEGGNLGADFYPSGTIAAAREAALLGFPAIALSQYIRKGGELDWDWTVRCAARVIRLIQAEPREPGVYWSVNFPHPTAESDACEIVFCPLDPHPMVVRFRETEHGLEYSGSYSDRPRRAGYDVDVCFSGKIAVTKLHLDINR